MKQQKSKMIDVSYHLEANAGGALKRRCMAQGRCAARSDRGTSLSGVERVAAGDCDYPKTSAMYRYWHEGYSAEWKRMNARCKSPRLELPFVGAAEHSSA